MAKVSGVTDNKAKEEKDNERQDAKSRETNRYHAKADKRDTASGRFVKRDIATVGKASYSRTYFGGGKAEHQVILSNSIGSVLVKTVKKPESQMTSIEKMEATKKGISKKALEQLKERAGLDYDQLSYMLGVARGTLIGKKGTERFSPVLSEKIMSLADIYSYGYEVFSDIHEFNEWIFQPINALGGKAPYDLLNSQYGREEVRNIIGRIDYGVYS